MTLTFSLHLYSTLRRDIHETQWTVTTPTNNHRKSHDTNTHHCNEQVSPESCELRFNTAQPEGGVLADVAHPVVGQDKRNTQSLATQVM